MASFLDAVPTKGRVTIGETVVDVPGLSFSALAQLCERFPDLSQLLNGGAGPQQLVGMARSAVNAMIAAGCGFPGDEKAEAHANAFPADQQLALMTEIVRVTTRGGFGPFVERLVALASEGQSPAPAPTSAPSSSASPST